MEPLKNNAPLSIRRTCQISPPSPLLLHLSSIERVRPRVFAREFTLYAHYTTPSTPQLDRGNGACSAADFAAARLCLTWECQQCVSCVCVADKNISSPQFLAAFSTNPVSSSSSTETATEVGGSRERGRGPSVGRGCQFNRKSCPVCPEFLNGFHLCHSPILLQVSPLAFSRLRFISRRRRLA